LDWECGKFALLEKIEEGREGGWAGDLERGRGWSGEGRGEPVRIGAVHRPPCRLWMDENLQGRDDWCTNQARWNGSKRDERGSGRGGRETRVGEKGHGLGEPGLAGNPAGAY
jgi:hypothetical protein